LIHVVEREREAHADHRRQNKSQHYE
jgi:hypothetical protein